VYLLHNEITSMKATYILSLLALLILAGTPRSGYSQDPTQTPQLGKNSVKEVLKAMTLEEKVRLLVGSGFKIPGMPSEGPAVGQTEDKVPGAAGTSVAIERLGIPSIVLADGPAGVRISPIRNKDSTNTFYATAFPVGTLLASTWDTTLVKNVGKAFGSEAHEYGIDVILAPALNIHRNPLGGRNFEYYSEDPVVSGFITASMVNGLESQGIGTSIKHFAANNQETNRNTVNTLVSERTLREIYLRGFEIAVKKSQPWTVMSSYNYINNKYTSEDFSLLTTILRKEWGFKGLVMTDWFGGSDPVAQMKAGNDLLMPGTTDQMQKILTGISQESLDISVLDQNVERMLELIVKSPSFKRYKFSNKPDLKKNAQISRTAAAEGMILLKNESALPLKSGVSVALFGNTSYDLIAGGTGSGDVNKAYTVSLMEGLTNSSFRIEPTLAKAYSTYVKEEKAKQPERTGFMAFMPPPPIAEMKLSPDAIIEKARTTDAALVTIGRIAGEFADRKLNEDYMLSDAEKQLIESVANAFHQQNKKVVVILNIGGVVEVASWRDKVDGILLGWQGGLEAGNAIADILSGKVNPSGKLTTTFPMQYNDVPSSKSFPGKEFPEQARTGNFGMRLVPAEVTYEEGIYVGYRYYNSFNVKPAYEFGYGLSYTTFTYSDLKVTPGTFKDKVTISVKVTNSGSVAGKEVVQVYVAAPKGKLDKPAHELKTFGKTELLQPGKSQVLNFELSAKDLASFDPASSSWILEAGKYEVQVGASSLNIMQKGTVLIPSLITVEKTNKVMAPPAPITELKRS
jgi:beta-glucosidase